MWTTVKDDVDLMSLLSDSRWKNETRLPRGFYDPIVVVRHDSSWEQGMLSCCSPIPNSSCCQVSELNVVLRHVRSRETSS